MLKILDVKQLGLPYIDLPELQGKNKPVMEEVKIPSLNIDGTSPNYVEGSYPLMNAAYRPAPQINGNLQVDPEISLPSPGMDVDIAYFYNSNSTYNGPYGYGRTINTNLLMAASGSPMLVTFQRGNGAIENYQETGVGTNVFEPLTPTLPNTLEKDTTNNLWKEATPDGRTMAYPLDTSGQIVSISYAQDSVGNCHTFSYSSGLLTSLEDAVGRKVSFAYDGNGYLETIQDWADRLTTFQYGTVTGQTVLTTVIGPSGCQTGYAYNSAPLLTEIIDPNGYATTYSYGTGGTVQQRTYMFEGVAQTTQYSYGDAYTQIIDPLGAITTLTRYYYWDLGASTDPLGHTVSFTNNAQGQQAMRMDPLGNIWTTVYDSAGFLSTATVDPLGYCTTIQRDNYNNPTTMIYADGTIATMVWGNDDATRAQHRLQATVDPLGNRSSFSYNARGQLTEAVIPLGQGVTHSHDEWGNRISSTNMLGQVTTMAYDLAGNVIASVDPLGHTTSISYDAQNRPIEITTPLGNIYTTAYDSVGNPVVQIDPLGRRTSFSYNVFDHPVDVQDMQGNRTTFGYDAVGRSLFRVNALGFHITTTYDAAGRIVSMQDPLGDETQMIYDAANRNIARVDANGFYTSVTYDAAGRAIAVLDPLGFTATLVYDAKNRPVCNIDALGHYTTTVYDLAGRTIATVNALNQRTSVTYDEADRPIESIDALNRRNTIVYDVLGRIQETVDALNQYTTFFYDAAGRQTAIEDARGFFSTATYDAASRLTSQQSPLGYTTSFLYDAADQRIAVQDALGFVWTSTYDDLGRLQNNINPLGHAISLAYDAVGQVIGNIDANGNTTSNTYDGAGQIISTMNALGYQTSLTYDASGRLIGVEDANGHRTTNVYDARGSLLERIDPLSRSVSYSYDAVANTTLRLDPRGILTTYSYDALNRMSEVLYPDGGSITNTFDAAGQLIQMADRTGVTSYVYDAVGRQTGVAYPVGKVLSYSYDGTGNRTKMQQGDIVTNYSHDPNNNLIQIVNPYNETTTFSYDALDREEQKMLANGVTINHTYDAAGRKVLLEQRTADTTALAIYTATYDAAGMQISTLELDGSVNDYSYDASYQLLNETRTGSNAFSTTYTYDPTGNRLTQNADGTLTTSTYDAANELFTATTNSDITTFTHDANGNRILENANGSLATYTWDEENRMVGADDGTNTDTFIYAGNGRRRKKSTSTQDINYLWDGQNILEELDDSNNLIAHYTGFPGYWGGLSSLAQPGSTPAPATAGMGTFNAVQFNQALFNQSSEQVETESHYYLFDLQASNRLLLNTNAATDNEYIYQSFGEKVLSSETIRNPFQFQGQVGPYFDAEKRTQMGARIVDPTMGKWFSPDPIRFAGGDWNLYRFVGNNPANLIDPSGLSCSCCNFFFAFAWCCDESCFTSPPIFLPKRNAYQGFGPWNNAIPDSGGGASQQWPLCSRSFAGGDHADIPFFLFDNSSWQNLWSDIEKGWYPTADALNPFGDPYKDMGYWSDKDINSQWSFGLGTVAQQALLTAALSPQAIAGAGRLAFGTKSGEAIFWAGGEAANSAAKLEATANGGKLLGATPGGKVAVGINWIAESAGISAKLRYRFIFDPTSYAFAKFSSGPARVLISSTADEISTWYRIEERVLQMSGQHIERILIP